MAEEKTSKTTAKRVARDKKTVELWISRGFSDHMITIVKDGQPDVVKFKDYKFECDLSSDEGKSISDGLHNCTREGRDIFVVGEAYDESDLQNRTEMLKKLRDMTISQLRSLVTIEDMISNNVPANTNDVDMLITLIMKTKSL